MSIGFLWFNILFVLKKNENFEQICLGTSIVTRDGSYSFLESNNTFFDLSMKDK